MKQDQITYLHYGIKYITIVLIWYKTILPIAIFGLDNIGIKHLGHRSSLLHRGRGKEERRWFSGVFTDRLTLGVCSCKIAYTKCTIKLYGYLWEINTHVSNGMILWELAYPLKRKLTHQCLPRKEHHIESSHLFAFTQYYRPVCVA